MSINFTEYIRGNLFIIIIIILTLGTATLGYLRVVDYVDAKIVLLCLGFVYLFYSLTPK